MQQATLVEVRVLADENVDAAIGSAAQTYPIDMRRLREDVVQKSDQLRREVLVE